MHAESQNLSSYQQRCSWLYQTDQTTSTNDDLAQLAAETKRLPDYFTLVAAHQTGGKGRYLRRWEDDGQGALLASTLVRVPVSDLPWISALAGLALYRAIWALTPNQQQWRTAKIWLKWPNDLLVQRKKAAGILAELVQTEDDMAQVVIGWGVNLSVDWQKLAASGTNLPAELQREWLGNANRAQLTALAAISAGPEEKTSASSSPCRTTDRPNPQNYHRADLDLRLGLETARALGTSTSGPGKNQGPVSAAEAENRRSLLLVQILAELAALLGQTPPAELKALATSPSPTSRTCDFNSPDLEARAVRTRAENWRALYQAALTGLGEVTQVRLAQGEVVALTLQGIGLAAELIGETRSGQAITLTVGEIGLPGAPLPDFQPKWLGKTATGRAQTSETNPDRAGE